MTKQSSPDRISASLPISYHQLLDESFDDWAAACGWQPQSLRKASERAIRTRHYEARISHESQKARGRQPNIYTLELGAIEIYYTVQSHAVIVRGYGWNIVGEPCDHFDGGGYYLEYEWMLPLDPTETAA